MRSYSMMRSFFAGILIALFQGFSCHAAVGDDLASLSDEFDKPDTLNSWRRVYRSEQWPADQLERFDINQTVPGCMAMVPYTSTWYRDYRGELTYKEVKGDFVVTSRLRVTGRNGQDAPRSQFSLGGILVRAPRDVTPETWRPAGENYIFLSLGAATNPGRYQWEVKTTVNSDSQLRLVDANTPEAVIQVARIGEYFILLRQSPDGAWTVHQRYHRPDLPETLQVGLTTYTDYPSTQGLTPQQHNSTVIRTGNPDLIALFDYIRYRRPVVPEALKDRSFSDPADVSDAELLRFLGEHAAARTELTTQPATNTPATNTPATAQPPVAQASTLTPPANAGDQQGATPRSSPPVPQGAGRPALGTNLSGLNDWSTEFSFVDAFKMSRAWISGSRAAWQDQRPLDVDEHGWVRSLQPDQIARTLMFWDLQGAPGRYPAGRYLVQYEGEGTLEYGGGARRVATAPGQDTLEVDTSRGGIALFITSVNPANYVRNIRVLMPGAAPASEVFYPPFLESLKGYRAVRFMNWMLGQNNNNIALRRWDERPKMEDARWTVRGAPVEVMVALANRLGADPWFTMSHLADEDSVRRFAQTVQRLLDPKRKVYVEHSNEVWNSQYPQAHYAQRQGQALGLSPNAFQAQILYHARRSREIFAIWEEVFPKEQLVRVLGSHAANPWVSEQMLGFEDVAAHTDALAIAPYFGGSLGNPQAQGTLQGANLDALMQELESRALPQSRDFMQRQATVARRFRVPLIAYEAGQHLVGVGPVRENQALNTLFDAANRDPRMGALYGRYLQDWSEAGGQLLMHYMNCFAYSKYGRWGALEYLDQPRAQAPKFTALQSFPASP